MELSKARELAEQWVQVLKPSCVRVEIAGSIRRKKPDVHDIELVAVPRMLVDVDMFGDVVGEVSQLDGVLSICESEGSIQMLKNGPKCKQIALPEQINIDLFLVTYPAQWGVIFLIRTGPAEFSKWMVTPRISGGALPDEYYIEDGAIHEAGIVTFATPEETDFFKRCGMEYIEPKDRQPRWGKVPAAAKGIVRDNS